jgi:hypothetical protein
VTLPQTPLYLFPQSWAAGWSCLSAVTVEAAVRVWGGPDRVRVGAGRRRSPNVSAEKNSSADQYFRDHLVVPSRHVILFPLNDAVMRLVAENNAPGVRVLHRGYSQTSFVLIDIIAR